MITLTALVFLVLAAFRLTTLVVTDSILNRPRAWLHRKFPVTGTYVEGNERPKRGKARFVNGSEQKWWIDKGTFLGDLTSCAFCTGVWVSVGLGVLWVLCPPAQVVVSVIAIAGGQLILSQWSSR